LVSLPQEAPPSSLKATTPYAAPSPSMKPETRREEGEKT